MKGKFFATLAGIGVLIAAIVHAGLWETVTGVAMWLYTWVLDPICGAILWVIHTVS